MIKKEEQSKVFTLASIDEEKIFLCRHMKWNDVKKENKTGFTLKRQYKISSKWLFYCVINKMLVKIKAKNLLLILKIKYWIINKIVSCK